MKFRTFRIVVTLVILGLLVAAGYLFCGRHSSAAPAQAAAVAAPASQSQIPAAPEPAPAAKPLPLTDGEVRMKIEQWLSLHPDRQDKMRLVDILSNEPFKATVLRFPEADAKKWSNDPSQWSQVRIDLNRDGVDDEKWLLKNGGLYKREVLDRNGKSVDTEYFK